MHEIRRKCLEKLERSAKNIRDKIPYTTINRKYNDFSEGESLTWWTNSFWAGILWRLYKETGNEQYSVYAVNIEKKLQQVLYAFNDLDHDLGFLWLHTGVVHYIEKKDEKSRSDALLAACVLASRFNIATGVIHAWNGEERKNLAIIDCMANLPLLYWASEELNDDRFKNIAIAHADNVIKYFIRENGSVSHVMKFCVGEKPQEQEGKGYKIGSSWTRGQSRAIYGFVQSYQWTKEERYLTASKKVADYFISEAEKNNWKIKCDFCQPEGEELYDTSAAAIVACGMIELYKETGEKKYLEAAINLITVCDEKFCPWDDMEDEALLNGGCVRYDEHKQLALIYGDFYFFNAVCELEKIMANDEFAGI